MPLNVAHSPPKVLNSSRRNGKPASCEPCRKNKTRCDHATPKCGQCGKRNILDQCFYHPAPLTKPREVRNNDSQQSSPRPRKRQRISESVNSFHEVIQEDRVLPTPSISHDDDDDNESDTVGANEPGFLGPTSYAAILPIEDISMLPQEGYTEKNEEWQNVQHPLTKAMRTQMAIDVLKSLRHYDLIRTMVIRYCETCDVGLVAEAMGIATVEGLKETVDQFDLTKRAPSAQLVASVLENTSRPLDLSPSLLARDFHTLITGTNLRFETLGWVLGNAGRSFLFGVGMDRTKEGGKPSRKDQFIHEMLKASTTCLFLATLLSPPSDIMIWMFYENLVFTSNVCGYSGPPTWRRLGELATQIYALGMHKESNGSHLPVFILETRRRVFGAAYNVDKTISTFLGRPLRLSKRHTDVKHPLDLSDEELVSDPQTLELACQSLDAEGWNTKGLYFRASWIRLRSMSSRFREEILDLALSKIDEHVEQQFLDISRRIRESWEMLPQHLQYWSGCWNENIPQGTCVMLVVVYLTHFYNEFMIQKLLDRQPLTSNTALLRVSMDMLTTTLTLGIVRDRAYDVHREFLHILLLYGVPSGSVLANALKEQHQTSAPFPPSISRSEMIRTLSVLISHLDAGARLDGGARLADGNYHLCRKAAKTFTRVVDAVLDDHPVALGSVGSVSDELNMNLDFFGAPGLDVFGSVDIAGTVWDGAEWGLFGQGVISETF